MSNSCTGAAIATATGGGVGFAVSDAFVAVSASGAADVSGSVSGLSAFAGRCGGSIVTVAERKQIC